MIAIVGRLDRYRSGMEWNRNGTERKRDEMGSGLVRADNRQVMENGKDTRDKWLFTADCA